MKVHLFSILLVSISMVCIGCGPKWTEVEKVGFNLVTNSGGQILGYSPHSGVKLLIIDRCAFKDLNKNDSLDAYEDWRLPYRERSKDLASRMSIDEIAGLMLYSGHQRIPGGGFRGRSSYGGKTMEESGAIASDLTDQQIEFLTDDNLRHVLITSVESPSVAAQWNNNAQALVEGLGLGIPANNSTDPRHQADADQEYTLGAGGDISRWPGSIGLAASFDPSLVRRFGEIASKEYRALGLATALSPQVDLATDPRWYRFSGTFGESPMLSTEMAKAYIDGFQSSSDERSISDGWGYESVNAMAKHWPGGGTGEGGRDAHYGFGKFGVFPGDNINTHMKPFIDGAFSLEGGTGMASAIMPYYTISYNQDPGGGNVGNAFSKYFITDMLREKYGFDGVVCTDWGVTRDDAGMAVFGRTPWGVEHLTEAERHYKILMAGCDQFGGNNDSGPVIEAYNMGAKEFGEEIMRKRFELSAVRLLNNIFRVGLFENPYLEVRVTDSIVGNPEFMKFGYEAQLKSIVMLKNKGAVLPISGESNVYIPKRYYPPSRNFFGTENPAEVKYPINMDMASKYFRITDDPERADMAIVVIDDPQNGRTGGYSQQDVSEGGNGFVPVSLQYKQYTASDARDPSIAGDAREGDILNRTYKNKTVKVTNSTDLDLIVQTKEAMNGKPVVVILKISNPTVVSEFEKEIDGLLINFRIQDQAILDVLSGVYEPTGLLPLQLPTDMITVETQKEDVPFDMIPHSDSEGNIYDFGFGLNWKGVISDERTSNFRIVQ